MDHPRRRAGTTAAVLALVVAAAQLVWAAPSRADAPLVTDPPTTSTTVGSPTTTGDPGTTTTAPDAGSTTTTAPGPSATTPQGTPTITIPTLVTGNSPDTGPPLSDPSPQIRSLLGQIGVLDGQKGLTMATQTLAGEQAGLDQANAAAAQARLVVAAAQTRLTLARSQLSSVATLAFMGAGGGVLSALLKGGPDSATIEREMVNSTIEYHSLAVDAALKSLSRAQTSLNAANHQVSLSTAQVAAGRLGVAAADATLTAARRDLAGSGRKGTWSLSIEGDSAFTGTELSQWFIAQGRQSQATVPIDQLAGFYVSEGQAEGVRGDMAFAQAMVETGGFTNPDTISLNNFAGIGHCDSCASGFDFKTAQLGVRGQIQLLKSYAEKTPKYANPLVDPRLVGPAGCCATWTQLTKTWASDPNYGPKILGVYQAMLAWLLKVRAAEPGPPPALVVSTSLVASSTTTTSTTTPH
jgi:Mannosyl-glycoprotein endo-beta-N-acetylglucosaminidase